MTRYESHQKPAISYDPENPRPRSEPMTDDELQWWLGFQAGELKRAGKPVQDYEALASPQKPRRELMQGRNQ